MGRAILTTSRASVAVSRINADADWHSAALLLTEYQRWLGRELGLDLAAAQPAAGAEFEDLARFYRPPNGLLLVGFAQRRPAGIVGVHRLTGAVGELKRMYVTPWARGRGLGRTPVTEAFAASGDLGFYELRLQTKPDAMAHADRLYRELGFREIPSYADLGVHGVTALALTSPDGPENTPVTTACGCPDGRHLCQADLL
ncbi:MAG: GNAT family N-acetyltransferase [Intrasporangium sp.]|uniref:GNAT family N-acetyltransferase n=1 Tax=Intrasporangium sp. TaxID=1925024 RepID=UPI0026486D40|nr:GNAT family N-acetyltransferase [Intrasporangium sp.]MDN5796674.1 GNAT family N-acetyltransferase [Intrasporangium sp.]